MSFKKYMVVDLDLSSARADEEAGVKQEKPFVFLLVTRVDSAFDIKLNSEENPNFRVFEGMELKTEIKEIWVTNTAASGKYGQILLGW